MWPQLPNERMNWIDSLWDQKQKYERNWYEVTEFKWQLLCKKPGGVKYVNCESFQDQAYWKVRNVIPNSWPNVYNSANWDWATAVTIIWWKVYIDWKVKY